MRRGHSKSSKRKSASGPGFTIHEDAAPVELSPPANTTANGPITPTFPPEPELRPSKMRRHGSKLLLALRSMTNSGKSITFITYPP